MLIKEMIKKEIDKLPEKYANEVYNFIFFFETRSEKELLAKASQSLSASSFEKIWDNEEDAVYDNLCKRRNSPCAISL